MIVPEIETERLLLRQVTSGDLDDWADRVFADPEVIRYMPRRDMTLHERAAGVHMTRFIVCLSCD